MIRALLLSLIILGNLIPLAYASARVPAVDPNIEIVYDTTRGEYATPVKKTMFSQENALPHQTLFEKILLGSLVLLFSLSLGFLAWHNKKYGGVNATNSSPTGELHSLETYRAQREIFEQEIAAEEREQQKRAA